MQALDTFKGRDMITKKQLQDRVDELRSMGAPRYNGASMSVVVSEVMGELGTLHADLADVRAMYAPSECDALVVAGSERRMRLLFARHGIADIEHFVDEVAERTSAKWVFFSGLVECLHVTKGGRE